MNTMWSWFTGSSNSSSNHIHNKTNTTDVCCSDSCKNDDKYICNEPECIQKHRGHLTMKIKQYKKISNQVDKEIRHRQQIEETIREYYHRIISQLADIFNKQIDNLLAGIDKHLFGKEFTQIYQRHKTNSEFASYLIDYQSGAGLEHSQIIRQKIKEKSKQIPQICKEFITSENIRLDQRILPRKQKIQQIRTLSKVEKIKSLLPFQCQLHSRFTATANNFSTRKLHATKIRGPIVLVAESYKKRTFGGYSPKMFSKEETYQEDLRCQSFLFSLDDRIRIPLKEQYKKFAIKGGDNLWFGRGDLAISNQCHKGNISWSVLGRAYETPRSAIGREDQWLGGAQYFRILQYTIYEVESSFQKT